ncbi:MAG TPA: hypothetical protein VG146_09305 [Verrucomicrobiae bacterium]|nr:hypothetical protein [Verrucomicrobiae bacterium]
MLLLLACALLTVTYFIQESMNHDRDSLGLTRIQPLENAPPALAFTTIALGGFRGLISNILWIRANDLQDQDKFFEMAQLADWITKLEPHFVLVWANQAWNMAYNISVKFKDYSDRWRWVEAGIELLRDQGLPENPNEPLLYRELGWLFQNKIGANLDDGNMYYKQQWLNEMSKVFGKKTPNLDELIHPQTQDQTNRARLLEDHYKMDPVFMKKVDEQYGPLEWRLPEASAVYWGAMGLKKAEENPTKIKTIDLLTLRRLIYQSMMVSFQRGRLIPNPFNKAIAEFGPNLDIIPKVSYAYEEAAKEDPPDRDHILSAHRNFLRDAVYFLYEHNRIPEASRWFNYLAEKYPNKTLLDFTTNSFPRNLTLDEYAVDRTQEDVSDAMSRDRVKSVIEGLLINAYTCLAGGQDERAAGFKLLANKVQKLYSSNTAPRKDAIPMPPIEQTQRDVLKGLLDPGHGLPPEVRAVLRSKLGMAAEAEPPAPASTNAPPESVSSR